LWGKQTTIYHGRKIEANFWRESDRKKSWSGYTQICIVNPYAGLMANKVWLGITSSLHDLEGNVVGILGTLQISQ